MRPNSRPFDYQIDDPETAVRHRAYPKLSAPVLGFGAISTPLLPALLDRARMRR